MKLTYSYSKSFLLLNRNLTKKIFLDKSGVKEGYSYIMFSKMYDSIFSELIDLDYEYEKYYSFEYTSLKEFLYKKYNLNEEDITELLEERRKNPACGLYRKDDNSYGDYGLAEFSFSEVMYERIINILMLKNPSQ